MALKKKPKKKRKMRPRPFIREPEPSPGVIHVEYKNQHALARTLEHAHQSAVFLIGSESGLEKMDFSTLNFFVNAVRAKDYLGAVQVFQLWREMVVRRTIANGDGEYPPELIIESMEIKPGFSSETLTELVEREAAKRVVAGIQG